MDLNTLKVHSGTSVIQFWTQTHKESSLCSQLSVCSLGAVLKLLRGGRAVSVHTGSRFQPTWVSMCFINVLHLLRTSLSCRTCLVSCVDLLLDGEIRTVSLTGAEHDPVHPDSEPADSERLSVHHEDGEPDQRTPVQVPAGRVRQEDPR